MEQVRMAWWPPGSDEMLALARRARSPSRYWSAESPKQVWRRARGAWDCRCEHEPQIRLTARSSPVGCPISQRGGAMEQIHDRVAGLDVHRDQVAVSVRTPGPRGGVHTEKARFDTTTGGLAALGGVAGRARRHAAPAGGHGRVLGARLLPAGRPVPGVAVQLPSRP